MSDHEDRREPYPAERQRAKRAEIQHRLDAGTLDDWFRILAVEEDRETTDAAWTRIVRERMPLVAPTARAKRSGLPDHAIAEIAGMVFGDLRDAVKRSRVEIYDAEGWLKNRIRYKTREWVESPDNAARINARSPRPADLTPADLTPADLTPADLTPGDLTPADLTPADLTPTRARSVREELADIFGENPKPTQLEVLLADEKRAILGRLLRHLSPSERRVVELRQQGHSYEKIGAKLDQSAGSCKALYSKAVARLLGWSQHIVLLDSMNVSTHADIVMALERSEKGGQDLLRQLASALPDPKFATFHDNKTRSQGILPLKLMSESYLKNIRHAAERHITEWCAMIRLGDTTVDLLKTAAEKADKAAAAKAAKAARAAAKEAAKAAKAAAKKAAKAAETAAATTVGPESQRPQLRMVR